MMVIKTNDTKLTLIEFLDKHAYKEEIQFICEWFDLPYSGTKTELLNRLGPVIYSRPFGAILDILSKDTLKSACSYYDLPVSGTKEELMNRIMKEIVIGRKVTVKSSNYEKEFFEGVKKQPDLINQIMEVFQKDELKDVLLKNGLPINGGIKDLRSRILDYTNRSPRKTLELFGGPSLQFVAEILDIPRRRSKEDQINELLVTLFNEEIVEKKHPANNQKTTSVSDAPRSQQQKKMTSIEKLIRDIETWTPRMRYPSEGEYRIDLAGYLEKLDYSTRMEEGSTLADILVNDSIPIEMKKDPKGSEYDRALAQVINHFEAHGSVIAVICGVSRLDMFEDFKNKVKRYVTNAHVIKK
ncbi:MAG: hypothetical protein AB9819_00615 [Methanomassiliicoccales archaeon]